jgi:lipopolysaccharide/colanic/teichoic acid biosynthesis glycosyltransferase
MLTKRIFDIVGSLVGLLILSPVLLLFGLLIKTRMPGSVFFSQQRVGRHGKLFSLVKFRTMRQEPPGGHITIKGDNRITPMGVILRRYKLDELPELWNVLKGDMSFVGPRPDVPGYADRLTGRERRILDVRPGITSPASMKYMNEEEILALQPDPVHYNDHVIYPDKVRINLEYIQRRNFWLDLKIIIYTVFHQKLKEKWAH